jgi:hypothetical protein
LSKHYLEILDQLVEIPGMVLNEFKVSSDLVAIKNDVLLEDDGSFGF